MISQYLYEGLKFRLPVVTFSQSIYLYVQKTKSLKGIYRSHGMVGWYFSLSPKCCRSDFVLSF